MQRRGIRAIWWEAEQEWNQAEITHGAVSSQGTTERTFRETGSQAEHKMTGHHGRRGELVNGRCEWEELKPQMKQPGHMNCPSPNRGPMPGHALRLTKGAVWKGQPVERDWANHGSFWRQKPEGKHSWFSARKCCCRGKGILWFSMFTENRSNTNSKNYSKESKVKFEGSTAWFVGSLSLKVFKNRFSEYEQESVEGGWPSFRTFDWLNLQRPLPGHGKANTPWHSSETK